MNRSEIVQQTKLAFDFIQKLYFEVSYLIKEIEGLFAEEEERFIICRPSGYNITARSSNGLDANSVHFWILRKLAVAFVKSENSPIERGQTITKITPETKVIYVRIILEDKDISEPVLYYGVLYDFVKKNSPAQWPTKLEQLLTNFEYNEAKIFAKPESISFEDANVRFKGKLFSLPLYDINSSEEIYEKIIKPALNLYNEVNVQNSSNTNKYSAKDIEEVMNINESQKERLIHYIPVYKKYTQSSEYREDCDDRQQRQTLFASILSPRSIDQMTELEFGQVISSLWASQMWGNKSFLVDKMIKENRLPVIRNN